MAIDAGAVSRVPSEGLVSETSGAEGVWTSTRSNVALAVALTLRLVTASPT